MALILSIDTATTICSVALHREGALVACEELHVDRSHSEYLTVSIAQTMALAGLNLADIDAVAISMGPGSYTGLRIGTSAAKGICYSLGTKLIAVNTLLTLAAGVSPYAPDGALLCPMIDARRMEVYYLLCDRQLALVEPTTAAVVDGNFLDLYRSVPAIWFFGSGAAKCRDTIALPGARFLEGVYPSARHMGALAWERYRAGSFEDVAYFEPYYLKDFRAGKPSGGLSG